MIVLFWLAIWQILYIIIGRDILFASPFDTLKALIGLLGEPYFYKTVTMSFIRITLGFAVGGATGLVLGFFTGCFRLAYDIFKPAVDVIKAAPVASFIILALTWFKTGRVPVFISFLTVVPIVWSGICEGMRSVDGKILEMAKMYGFTFSQKVRNIYFPSLRPYFRSAIVTGAGFAFKSGIAAEVIGSPSFSIGRRLYESKLYLETAQLFAWTAVVILLSVFFEKMLVRFVKR